MHRKAFVCLCRQTISRICTLFNTVHSMSNINNMYQFQDIWRIFTRGRARTDRRTERRTDRQTNRQTNRMHKHFSTLLESVKNRLSGSRYEAMANVCAKFCTSAVTEMYLYSAKTLTHVDAILCFHLSTFNVACRIVNFHQKFTYTFGELRIQMVKPS